jgi:hypothetical protein
MTLLASICFLVLFSLFILFLCFSVAESGRGSLARSAVLSIRRFDVVVVFLAYTERVASPPPRQRLGFSVELRCVDPPKSQNICLPITSSSQTFLIGACSAVRTCCEKGGRSLETGLRVRCALCAYPVRWSGWSFRGITAFVRERRSIKPSTDYFLVAFFGTSQTEDRVFGRPRSMHDRTQGYIIEVPYSIAFVC